ncbi:efflux RND transporter periplasmic adaptor subunit [Pseudorhodoplanes sinuspersici]|nr:efflux RND transporter periplasmic adaptor subunit [Pseudorhodoplanes sinuspersici]RKE72709.1 Cu(I)/Ag(I) efflux system membrane fusion protein [Pseudorhodoplanes sinuspersici]
MKITLASLRSVALGALASLIIASAAVQAQPTPGFEPVAAEVPVGKNVRIELRLTGITPPPALADITIERQRIDMGPDGMEMMAAPLKPVPGTPPGILAFQTDLSMAGRWALTITARVKGQSAPITSKIIFTAVEKKSDAAPAPGSKRKIVYYRNPMGLPDVSPTPKKDSMGMDYIPVYEDEANGPRGSVRLASEKVQRAGVRLEPATLQQVARTVRAPGTVSADETRLGVVTAKFNGFVEELYVPAVGERVSKGQKLMRVWIESPEILQKQADLTTTLIGATRSSISYEGAERNLRFFGFTDEAVDEIRKAGRPLRSLTFNVPRDGTVLEKPAVVGMRFSSGDTLFRTADLTTLWVIAQVPESDIAVIREGQQANVSFKAFPNEPREGKVALIYPELNPATRTVPVRIVVDNKDMRLRPGLYAEISFAGEAQDKVVTVPDSAVIDSGQRRVAFVSKGEGLFEPRDVELGRRGNGLVEIRKGIEAGENVVVRGNFLIDAESNLKAALASFAPPAEAVQ